MNRTENAVDKFNQGYACSQAILTEYCELFDLDNETALKLATGFAAGMRNGRTCGAVTGAYMVLGLKFGDQNCVTADGRKKVYDAVVEFINSFEQGYGSTDCEKLLGCNVGTADGMKKAKEENLFYTICPKLINSSSEILETILNSVYT
ncbi:MAG: C_GCAxxG_C_C family protein [Deltaproteobacteria bacterium]|nr:C_GCAxxG_C_C family protein [Deltaproteobacteria bacterium]